jgi:lysophospholipase L1-like esterase
MVLLITMATLSLTIAAPSSASSVRAVRHTQPVTRYYLALGDSIAAGYSATSTNGYLQPPPDSYVGLIYRHERAKLPGLKLVSYACGGATSVSMLDGPNPCRSDGQTQMGLAQKFLLDHPDRIALVTIDIGFNDIYTCFLPTRIGASCVTAGLQVVSASLPVILSEITRDYPGVPIVGMNYYDPLIAYDIIGKPALAPQSVGDFTTLSTDLSRAYRAAGAKMANVLGAFASTNTTNVVVGGKSEPQNLANICQWTYTCSGNPHPNNVGHARIAAAFYRLLPKH